MKQVDWPLSIENWEDMSNDDLRQLMDGAREECDRRMSLLTEAKEGRPKGPGRPRKNGSTTTITAADMRELMIDEARHEAARDTDS